MDKVLVDKIGYTLFLLTGITFVVFSDKISKSAAKQLKAAFRREYSEHQFKVGYIIGGIVFAIIGLLNLSPTLAEIANNILIFFIKLISIDLTGIFKR